MLCSSLMQHATLQLKRWLAISINKPSFRVIRTTIISYFNLLTKPVFFWLLTTLKI